MGGNGDVAIADSEYGVSLTANVSAGPAQATLDLPTDTPITQVYDGTNVPGAKFRLQLANTRVPHWFLFASGVTNDGPPVSLTLRRCLWLIPSVLGWNLKGTFRLPTPWPGEARNQSLTVGNVTFKTLDEPVNIFCWGVYLSGPETDVTISGQTLICELHGLRWEVPGHRRRGDLRCGNDRHHRGRGPVGVGGAGGPAPA